MKFSISVNGECNTQRIQGSSGPLPPNSCQIGKNFCSFALALQSAHKRSNILKHYVFNLRDFSRVVLGCLLVPAKRMGTESDKLIRLWVHEAYRVFYDRLTNDEDRSAFFGILKETVSSCFKANLDKVLGHLSPTGTFEYGYIRVRMRTHKVIRTQYV